MTPADRDEDRELERWLAEVRVDEAAAARTRVRRLVDQAAEEGTMLSALLDLAERSATVRIDTSSARSFHGVVTAAGRDFVIVAAEAGSALVALATVASVRTTEPAARPPAERRTPTHGGSFAEMLTELAADRQSVALVVNDGRNEPLTGTVLAVGGDVVTLRTDGAAPLTVYASIGSLLAVLLPSG